MFFFLSGKLFIKFGVAYYEESVFWYQCVKRKSHIIKSMMRLIQHQYDKTCLSVSPMQPVLSSVLEHITVSLNCESAKVSVVGLC